jgi:prepilin-type N-terminal cleavage/methylation domain-containing protein
MAHLFEQLPSAQPARSPIAISDQRGFTLPEVIVAMLVMVVGLVAMAGLLMVTLRMQQLGRNSTSEVRMAQDKVDELSSMSFTTGPSIQCGGSLTANVANYNDVPVVNGVNQPYRRRWLVQAGPDADPQLRMVSVRLIPTNPNRNISTQYDLVTILRGAGVAVCP